MKQDQYSVEKLEKLAQVFWEILLDTGLSDGHCKMYDPLTIDKEDGYFEFHSYVFDHGDGGRHRSFKTLEEGRGWLIESFKDWIKREQENHEYEIQAERREAVEEELKLLLSKLGSEIMHATVGDFRDYYAVEPYIKDRLKELKGDK